ncbi:hypothetical protein N9383_00065 [Granulosicoccus sp.]|nr:hypothetical protein [Granulosicoccus sp.]
MTVLLIGNGLGPGYYHLAGLWRRELSFSDKWNHLGGSAYNRAVNRLNPVSSRSFSQHKFVEKAILQQLHVPCMTFAGYISVDNGVDANGAPLRSAEDFRLLLLELAWTEICIKPVHGYGGKGFAALDILIVKRTVQVREMGTTTILSADDYWHSKIQPNRHQGLMLEAFIQQHPDYKRFNPSSVNTLRLWLRRFPDGRSSVCLGYLRVGRRGSLVDNQSSGGIVVPVDLTSGKLANGLCGTPQRREYATHPDHNAPLQDEYLSRLDEAQALALRCFNLFPGLNFVGVDVAMTTEGPVMVELNASPDRQGSAFVDKPSAPILN